MGKYKNWVMLTLGTGIGGGVIIDNKIYTGAAGNAMEVGHTTIDFNGKLCSCGSRGCLERYASATALVDLARTYLDDNSDSSIAERIAKEPLTAELIYEEAVKKDALALKIFDQLGTYLGIGVANLVNIFAPEAIVFGGGLSKAGKVLLPILKKVVKERALPGLKEHVEYIILKDQSQIPALGAVKIAMDAVNATR